jgi:hypothetical protein
MADVMLVTNVGLGIVNNRMKAEGTEPNYIAWGIGTTAPAAADTALASASAEARTAGTSSLVTTSTTNDTYQVVGSITCTAAAKAITEVGLFDAATVGNLFVRGTFSAINVSIGDSVQFTIKNVLSRG